MTGCQEEGCERGCACISELKQVLKAALFYVAFEKGCAMRNGDDVGINIKKHSEVRVPRRPKYDACSALEKTIVVTVLLLSTLNYLYIR